MARKLTKEEWRRKKRRKRVLLRIFTLVLLCAIITIPLYVIYNIYSEQFGGNKVIEETIIHPLSNGEEIKLEYLTPNPYSRPQKKLKKIKGVVIHYTANPGTTAQNNRSYFEGLANSKATSVSSHFVIGLEGEVIQCIPLTEIAYASNNRNDDTVAIECCHPDKTGKFNKSTYQSLVCLAASLCIEYDLEREDIIRHYDITGKLCPLYYVEHKDAWEAFRDDVMKEVTKLKSEQVETK